MRPFVLTMTLFSLVCGMGAASAAIPAPPRKSVHMWKRSQASPPRTLRKQRRIARAFTVTRLSGKRSAKSLRRLDLRPRLNVRKRVAQARGGRGEPSEKTLAEVYSMANRHNVDVKILKQRLRLAELARSRAWVALHPSVSVSGGYTRNQQEVAFNGAVITPLNQLNLGMQVNWTFLNFSLIPAVQAARLGQAQTKIVTAQTRRELFFSITRGYYNVLLAQGAVDIAAQSHRQSQANLRQALLRQKAGVAAPIALAQSRLDEARARQSVQSARSSLTNARLALALLLGQKTFPYRAVRPKVPMKPMGTPTDWRRDARVKREEIRASRVGVKIQQAKVRQAWTNLLPKAGANAGIQLSNATGFANQNVQWSAGLSLQWQLYNGNHAINIQEGNVGLRQARLELRKQEQRVDNDIRTAWNQLQNARRATKLARQSAMLARQTLKLQQQRYRSGTATPLAVSDALGKSYSAEISQLRESLNEDLATIGLQRAVGVFPKRVREVLARWKKRGSTRLARR